jgi:hypothetical protein
VDVITTKVSEYKQLPHETHKFYNGGPSDLTQHLYLRDKLHVSYFRNVFHYNFNVSVNVTMV